MANIYLLQAGYGLTLRQNKYVLRASRGKGHYKNQATMQFILSTRY